MTLAPPGIYWIPEWLEACYRAGRAAPTPTPAPAPAPFGGHLGAIDFVAEIQGEVRAYHFEVEDRDWWLWRGAEILDGVTTLAELRELFAGGVYPSLAAYRSEGSARSIEEVIARGCELAGIAVVDLEPDDEGPCKFCGGDLRLPAPEGGPGVGACRGGHELPGLR